MVEVLNVLSGDVMASSEDVFFKSSAIGSCVVVTGYDKYSRVGGMAHVMLPGSSPKKTKTRKTKYAHDAIRDMLNQMIHLGAIFENIEVCVVGGSNVLKRPDDTICQANIDSVINFLKEAQIKIKATSVGGTRRRSVWFNSKTNSVYHSIGGEKGRLLCCYNCSG